MRLVKQYGLPYSGTNCLRWILENNYRCRVLSNILGYKHGPPSSGHSFEPETWYPPELEPAERIFMKALPSVRSNKWPEGRVAKKIVTAGFRGLRYVLTIRDPYSWIWSVCHHKKLGLTTISEVSIQVLTGYWAQRMDEYNDFAATHPRRTVVIDHEALTDADELRKAFARLRLISTGSLIQLPRRRVLQSGDRPSRLSNEAFDPGVYSERHYRRGFTRERLDLINSVLEGNLRGFEPWEELAA